MLGTVVGIVTSFRPIGTDKRTALAILGGLIGHSIVSTCLGLVTALLAFCCYKYLSAMLEAFDLEMHTATLQMMNDLAIGSRTTRSQ